MVVLMGVIGTHSISMAGAYSVSDWCHRRFRAWKMRCEFGKRIDLGLIVVWVHRMRVLEQAWSMP